MKKKVLAAFLVAAMGASLLAGCGSTTTTTTDSGDTAASTEAADAGADTSATGYALDKSYPAETVKLGMEVYDTTAENYIALSGYFEYLEENYNVEFVFSESLASAEDEMDFLESCAASGCKGIIGFYNIAQGEAIQHCIDLGMYYWGSEEYYDQFADNEYYVGCYTFQQEGSTENGDYQGGYAMGYGLAENGVTHVFYCAGGATMGIQMFIDRQAGFEAGIAAAQADGYEITYDPSADCIDGWPGTDDFAAALSAKLNQADYDGLASSFGVEACLQPIFDAGRGDNLKCAAIGQINDTFKDSFESGLISVIVYDCEEVVFGNAFPLLVNAIEGNPIRNEDGTAPKLLVDRWTVTDFDTYTTIYDKHVTNGEYYITAAQLADTLVELNSEANLDSIAALYKDTTY